MGEEIKGANGIVVGRPDIKWEWRLLMKTLLAHLQHHPVH